MKVERDMMTFQKYVGTGNDFLIVDAQAEYFAEIPKHERSKLSRRICDRHFGAGGDGLIFLSRSEATRLRWDFYNSDGSPAEMCGNASRCVGRWAERNLGLPMSVLETIAGPVRIEARDRTNIVSHLDYVDVKFQKLEAKAAGRHLQATLVNTGVPHAVIDLDPAGPIRLKDKGKVRASDLLREMAALFRFHPDAGAAGANVTFMQKLEDRTFATVTFERGIEDFTLSCGTGVLAAGAVGLMRETSSKWECHLEAPGGSLKVNFGADWRGASLEGRAEFVYEAKINKEFLETKDKLPWSK